MLIFFSDALKADELLYRFKSPSFSGVNTSSLELEGNTIEYKVENELITLTITDETGGTTSITVPIGSFTF